VELADSCAFPTGGGQPADTGTLNGARFSDCVRDADGRVQHWCERAFEAGDEVCVAVDWERRWDHMQHHSAQHVISAMAVHKHAGIRTISWELSSAGDCAVELDCDPSEHGATLSEIEAQVNEAVLGGKAITPRQMSKEECEAEMALYDKSSTEHLFRTPERFAPVAELRVVFIEHVDANPCCGTHVPSTAQLQAVKFTGVERIARDGKKCTKLSFVAGERLRLLLENYVLIGKQLKASLSCGPEGWAEKAAKLVADGKEDGRRLKKMGAELHAMLGEGLVAKAQAERLPAVHIHRIGADTGALNHIIDAATAAAAAADAPLKLRVLATAKDEEGGTGAGSFVMAGLDARGADKELAAAVLAAIEGKGGGKDRVQGKLGALQGVAQAMELLSAAPPDEA